MANYDAAMALSARDLIIELVVVLVITLITAFLGPFGSFELGGFVDRFLYWSLMIFGGYAIVRPFMLLASGLSARLRLPEAPVWFGLLAVAAFPVTLLVWFGSGAARLPSAADFLHLYPNVLIIGSLIALVFWAMNRQGAAPAAEQPASAVASSAPNPSAGPRLLERLSPAQRQPIIALETEDHYVRVHSEAGSTLILIRMRDAIAEMAGVEGMQVHRSWWVARSAVVGHENDGRALRLKLANGLLVPVARASVKGVQDAGWLSGR